MISMMMSANAARAINDATTLQVLFNEAAPAGASLGYGIGYNPYCNATDEADMPLCAFLPRPIHSIS